jgi:hypothetical protein
LEPRWAKMREQGLLSPISGIPAFNKADAYRRFFPPPMQVGIPALDLEVKSTGEDNLNHISYIAVSRAYLHDSLRAIASHPEGYLAKIAQGLARYSQPPSHNEHMVRSRKKIQSWEALWDVALYGQFRRDDEIGALMARKSPQFIWRLGLFACIAIPGLVVWACRRAFRAYTTNRPMALLLLFLVTNIIYVSLFANLLEIGENNRMRFMIDPLVAALAGLYLESKLRLRSWR